MSSDIRYHSNGYFWSIRSKVSDILSLSSCRAWCLHQWMSLIFLFRKSLIIQYFDCCFFIQFYPKSNELSLLFKLLINVFYSNNFPCLLIFRRFSTNVWSCMGPWSIFSNPISNGLSNTSETHHCSIFLVSSNRFQNFYWSFPSTFPRGLEHTSFRESPAFWQWTWALWNRNHQRSNPKASSDLLYFPAIGSGS